MHITYTTRSGKLLYSLHGELTMQTVAHFTDVFSRAQESTGLDRIILNLAEVALIDSCGLGALVSAQRSVQSGSGEIQLVGVRAGVMEMLRITKLDSRFNICETVEDALSVETANPEPSGKT